MFIFRYEESITKPIARTGSMLAGNHLQQCKEVLKIRTFEKNLT